MNRMWVLSKAIGWTFPVLVFLLSMMEKLLRLLARRHDPSLAGERPPRTLMAAKLISKPRLELARLREEAQRLESEIRRSASEEQDANPLDRGKETIFLIVTSGQAVRSYLVSDAMTRLKARFNLVVISQYAYSERFREEHAAPGVHILPWLFMLRSCFTRTFQYYFLQSSESTTQQGWIKNLDARSKKQRGRFSQEARLRKVSNLLGSLLGPRGLTDLYHSYLLSYMSKSMFDRLFEQYRPKLVISTTAHHAAAWPLSYVARRRGIPTLSCVLSWDNCTTKPMLDPYAESCAVWSDEMKADVERYFPYLPAKPVVAGAPMFDIYYQEDRLLPREEFLGGLALAADQPVVLYCTNTPAAMPDEPELVQEYWKALSRTRFGGKLGLLVRLHPADDPRRYEMLHGIPGLVITCANEGPTLKEGYKIESWVPDRAGISLLVNSVRHAAVSINVASTMSLESFAAGVPTINVAFRVRPEVREKFLWGFDMYHTSDHYRALVENGAVEIARSMDDLVAQTVEVLEHGTRRAAAMQTTLAQKVGHCDGSSSQRFVELVETLASGGVHAVVDSRDTASLPVTGRLPSTVSPRIGSHGGTRTTGRTTIPAQQAIVAAISFVVHAGVMFPLLVPYARSRFISGVQRLRGRPSTPAMNCGSAEGVGVVEADKISPAPVDASPVTSPDPVAEPERPVRDRFAAPPAVGRLTAARKAIKSYAQEVRRNRKAARRIGHDIEQSAMAAAKLDRGRPTVFLIITCGQAIRNFLVSDFYLLMADRYNLVILSPYAYSDEFRAAYQREGVHVLPWFNRYRPVFERLFLYYLMKESGSGTHEGWLRNLETRAEGSKTSRYAKQHRLSQASNMLGRLFSRKGMLGLYQSYMVAMLPKSMFTFLFEHYRPDLVISTAVHHSETWPLTYHARRYGVKTLGAVLSWDNTTTKPAIDPSCDVCAVWSEEMAGEVARHFPYLDLETQVTGSPLFDMYYNRRLASDRASFLAGLGLAPELPYILYTTNTPAATSDEHVIVQQYWEALCRSPLAGKVSLLIRLHPKQRWEPYRSLEATENVAVTLAGAPIWDQADRWIPDEGDMRLLLNSMVHASVSVNIASTMSLESFAVGLPTINVALQSSEDVLNPTLMWSFDMFHTSDHYKAIVENGAVDIARSIDELVAMTTDALEHGARRQDAMRRTLEQKAAYSDGTSAARLAELVDEMLMPNDIRRTSAPAAQPGMRDALHPLAAE